MANKLVPAVVLTVAALAPFAVNAVASAAGGSTTPGLELESYDCKGQWERMQVANSFIWEDGQTYQNPEFVRLVEEYSSHGCRYSYGTDAAGNVLYEEHTTTPESFPAW